MNTIHTGDCLEWLKTLPDGIVNTCVTSPPYFGLRDYGTAKWEGGDESCDHVKVVNKKRNNSGGLSNIAKGRGETDYSSSSSVQYADLCAKCGAKRIDNQIGLEETPEAFVQKLVEVFREVKRVLKDDGTLWLNLGDSYYNKSQAGGGDPTIGIRNLGGGNQPKPKIIEGLKPKDLIGIPWMVAFALRADGWHLRQDIIWHKPNPMPESVTDRCTKAHEYIFLLSKSAKYYYDADAISEKAQTTNGQPRQFGASNQNGTLRNDEGRTFEDNGVRNKRSVWTVTTKPFKDAHFATFPEDLIVDCIKAGCPEGGIVLDPFGGAGTTGVVASKLNRKYLLCELNPEYVNIAEKRIHQTLGLFG